VRDQVPAGALIDPRAVVSEEAVLAPDVRVGPFAIIGPRVEIGAGTEIGPHAIVRGPTRIGAGNRIFPFCAIGDEPQDKKYHGEDTLLEIGDRNTIREYTTVNRGTVQGGGVTRLGDDNWIMAYVHIAHDCILGNHTVLANAVALAGHVTVDDWAILSASAKVHQFCRIGAHAFVGHDCGLVQDVPPYVMVAVRGAGEPPRPYGINSEGLTRRGFTPEALARLKEAYRILYRENLRLEEALAALEERRADAPEIGPLVDFLRGTTRGIVRGS
jgi:UDP-N-acetylglucosamine acyltransferase